MSFTKQTSLLEPVVLKLDDGLAAIRIENDETVERMCATVADGIGRSDTEIRPSWTRRVWRHLFFGDDERGGTRSQR